MRVLIHYKPKSTHDAFEGIRIRKTLKGECESVGIQWTDNHYEPFDIAHFISFKDKGVLERLSQKSVKTVISAFYSERDRDACFLKTDRFGKIVLRKTAKAFLNEADAILVPSIPMKKYCEDNGIKSQVFVCPPPVNVDRFVLSDLESRLFLRYFGVSKERKYVLVTGNFYERKKLSLLLSLARSFPQMRFYFLGSAPSWGNFLIRHYQNKAPDNLRLSRVLNDDVYRSALKHASAYLSLSSLPDGTTIMEAFAAKTPVIAYGDQSLNPLLIDGITCHLCKSEKELIASLEEVYAGRQKETIISAFAIAKKNTIERSGPLLKAVYEYLMNKSKKEANKP